MKQRNNLIKKHIFPLLLLSVLLTACQSNQPAATNPTTQQSPSTSNTTSNTTPTTKPTTEPTTTGEHSTTNTINNAKKITVGMTREDVYELLQINGQTIFSNVTVHKWALDNGKFLYVWFHTAENDSLVGGVEICETAMTWPNDSDSATPDILISTAYADRIQVGMTQSDVFTQLENNGMIVCTNAEIVQYTLKNGGYALIWYAEIDGIKTVCKTEVRGGALA